MKKIVKFLPCSLAGVLFVHSSLISASSLDEQVFNRVMDTVTDRKESVLNLTKQKAENGESLTADVLPDDMTSGTEWQESSEVRLQQTGLASWYGRPFHGRRTASGEVYNMYKMTAAHKKLPLHTRIRVTNLKNNKSVTLKVNDRGPYVGKRILDVSYAAAKELGFASTGITKVKIEVLK